MRGNLIIHAAGGAGINSVSSIIEDVKGLGEAFANVIPSAIDTTDKTIVRHPNLQEYFYKITSNKVSLEDLDGTGGERKNKEAVDAIKESIKHYIDERFPKNNREDYHVVVASASGGSGSLITHLLTQQLSQLERNVIVILFTDTSNLLYANNSINTIAGINSLAKKSGIVLPVSLIRNNLNGVTTPKSEEEANLQLLKELTILSLFTSGSIKDLDHQDMSNFFRAHVYKTFNINPGAYAIGFDLNKLKQSDAFIARTIVTPEIDEYVINIPLVHNKEGTAREEHIKAIKKDNFPIFLTLRSTQLGEKVSELKADYEKLSQLSVINNSDVTGVGEDDEDGLIL